MSDTHPAPHVPTERPATTDAERPWLLRHAVRKPLAVGALVLLAVLTLLDLVIHGHPHFGIDGTFGFHAWYGLLSGIGVVVIAKVLGIFLKRADGYYDID